MNMREYATILGSRLRSLAEAVGKFLIWWRDELLALAPERWQRHLRLLDNSLILELEDEQACFRFGNLADAELLERLPLDERGVPSTWPSEQVRARADKAAQVILLLPEQRVLRKPISLPAVTEGKLHNVLHFEMDRYTPFKSEQVYFGHRLLRRDPSHERIEVELIVVQRDYLEPILAKLAEANLHPGVVSLRATTDGGARLVNLLPISQGSASRDRWSRNRRLQVGLALAALLLVLGWPFYQQQQQVRQLEGEVRQLKGLAEQASGVGTTLEHLQQSREFLALQQAKAPQTLLLLDELTALLPDHTWLTRFEDSGTSLRLDGESSAASSLIRLLESSPMLENVRFASPVTANPNTSRERFSLVAEASTQGTEP